MASDRPEIDPNSYPGIVAANLVSVIENLPPRPGLSMKLPDFDNVTLASDASSNIVANVSVDTGRGGRS